MVSFDNLVLRADAVGDVSGTCGRRKRWRRRKEGSKE